MGFLLAGPDDLSDRTEAPADTSRFSNSVRLHQGHGRQVESTPPLSGPIVPQPRDGRVPIQSDGWASYASHLLIPVTLT
jgi:hypothetical protein